MPSSSGTSLTLSNVVLIYFICHPSTDAPVHLMREVVLLTNDRNLRVKALNQNVPVKDIISFVKWAKL